ARRQAMRNLFYRKGQLSACPRTSSTAQSSNQEPPSKSHRSAQHSGSEKHQRIRLRGMGRQVIRLETIRPIRPRDVALAVHYKSRHRTAMQKIAPHEQSELWRNLSIRI